MNLKHAQLHNALLTTVSVLLIAMIIVGLFSLLMTENNYTEDNPIALENTKCIDLLDKWIYKDSGKPVSFERLQSSAILVPDADGTVQICTVLEETPKSSYLLFFRVDCSQVEVFCNGTLIYNSVTVPLPTSAPDMFRAFRISLPEMQKGDEITVLFSAKNTDRLCLQFPCCGMLNAIRLHILNNCKGPIIITLFATVMMVVGLIVFVYRLLHGKYHAELLLIALFAFLSIIWIISDCGLGILIFRYSVVLYYIDYTTPILLIVIYLLIVHLTSGKAFPHFLHLALALLLVLAAAVVLHQSGVMTLRRMMLPFIILMLVSFLYSTGLILSKLQKNAVFLKTVAVVMLAVMTASFIIYLVDKTAQGSLFFRYALAFIVLATFVSLVRHINQLDREARQAETLRREKAETESRMLVSQINSHFFYNTINTIRGLILSDPDNAYKMTGDFGKYVRYRVNSAATDGKFSTFREELRAIRAYADICEIQMNHNLQMNYEIESDAFLIPTLTVEPFVENAIKHGIYQGSGEGCVTVKAKKSGTFWIVSVSDNGCGFDAETLPQSKGVGIENIRKRLAQYPGCSVSIDSQKGCGTTVTILYPDEFGGVEYESNPC